MPPTWFAEAHQVATSLAVMGLSAADRRGRRRAAGRAALVASVAVALVACLPARSLGQAPPNATLLPLSAHPDALCLDGRLAFVYVSLAPQPSDLWVFNFGASPTLAFCVDLKSCLAVRDFMAAQPPPPASVLLAGWGVQSRDCVDNPDFCNANHVLFPIGAFSPGCDLGLMVSRDDVAVNETFSLRFRGPQIVAATVAALVDGGAGPMSGARDVLLTGVTFGGMAAVLAADLVQAELRRALPALQRFKVMPVDAIHPRYYSTIWMAWGDYFTDSWMTLALQFLANVTGGPAGLPASPTLQACANSSLPLWECLYLNASLPYVLSPLFLVQQLGAVWDSQCQFEGASPTDNLMQVQCSKSSSTYERYYTCVQYPDLCDAYIVANFSVPLQHVYSAYANASALAPGGGAGNGYFLHSCYLGVYSLSGRGNTSVWNIISVGGVTLREAVSSWWGSSVAASPALYHDCFWNASGVPPDSPSSDVGAGAAASPYFSYGGGGGASGAVLGAPIVPPWTSRYFCNRESLRSGPYLRITLAPLS